VTSSASAPERRRPTLAVVKLASCDGCQLSLLNLEREILEIAERFDIAHFLEASSRVIDGPWDIVLVEGSVTTPADAARIQEIRAKAGTLIAIGECATAGGIQALRNRGHVDIEAWKRDVYPHPEWIETLATSTPISEHVRVDAKLEGCPINPQQVLRVLTRALLGARPDLPGMSVCMECKRRGHPCVLVTRNEACLGPITRAGCGALCPSLGRDCYGCFGPSDDPNVPALADRLVAQGRSPADVARRLRGIAGWQPPLRSAAERLERQGG
jgi:coenzyme F420-reducing hydrogenase gamma subunit